MLCSGVEGQELARTYFRHAIAGGRLSHAYLLVGPRGVGKSRFALELAGTLLCHRRRAHETEACGECKSCRTIAGGNHPRFTSIDPPPGKRLEIDGIRGCIDEVALRGGDRHVVRIGNAERMSTAAANALLKTLEEPPPEVIFLLVTAQPAQLPETIHSRCQRVPFSALAEDAFQRVLAREGRNAEEIPRLHAATGGSPGAALSLLDGIAACGGAERFRDLIDGVGADRPEALGDYLPARQEAKRDRVRRLLELLRDGLWARRAPLEEEERHAADVAALAPRVLRLDELLQDLDGNVNPELVLERTAAILRERE